MDNDADHGVAELDEGVGQLLTESDEQAPVGDAGAVRGPGSRDVVMRIPVALQVVLGKVKIAVADLLKLGPGSVIELDRRIGEPVDLVVNGHLIARGKVVVVDEAQKRFGVSLTEIVQNPTGS